MKRIDLRKGTSSLYLEYGGSSTNNLSAYDIQLVLGDPTEVSVDLGPNLRTRNKQGNGFADASALADGNVDDLSLVQISEGQVIRALARYAGRLSQSPWKLRLRLDRLYTFSVNPEIAEADLFLRVVRS
jgi:hypothetical protein